ncbi:unnamed protein product [Durusdinium trenchii]|uniref:Uncharacterized protein n=1 Tax=Durusdinium trenchii TaxID=1381693 RepID=A0ABP0K5A5_9DINO
MEDYAPPERQPISVVADEVLQSEVGTEVGSGANSEVKEPTNEPSRRAEQAINDAAERLAGSGGREDSEDQSTADGTDQSAEEASAQTEAPNEAETVITETNSSDEVNVTGSEDVALKSSEVVSDEAQLTPWSTGVDRVFRFIRRMDTDFGVARSGMDRHSSPDSGGHPDTIPAGTEVGTGSQRVRTGAEDAFSALDDDRHFLNRTLHDWFE